MITKDAAAWATALKYLGKLKNYLTAANLSGAKRALTSAGRIGTVGLMGMPMATGLINKAVGYDPREAFNAPQLPQFGPHPAQRMAGQLGLSALRRLSQMPSMQQWGSLPSYVEQARSEMFPPLPTGPQNPIFQTYRQWA
jgi:hypothetical protein